MRRFAIIVLILLGSGGAWAQTYPNNYAQQTYAPPQTTYPQAPAGTIYAGQPTYVPQRDAANPPPAQAAPSTQPHPGDYGQSGMTDIRQMNF